MSQLFILFIILLIGIVLLVLLAVLALTFNRTRDLRSCLLPLLGVALLAVAVLFLDLEKLAQCAFNPPEQIRLAGHVTLKNNSSANDYLVLLYKGDKEVTRYLTRSGRLPSEEEDREGYFDLTAPNELGLTRCSTAIGFEQERAGYDLLWMNTKTTYLWRDFTGLEPGASLVLNNDEPRKTYRLVVLPVRVGRYPHEIRRYTTYLDPHGDVAINVPVKTYRVEGSAAADPTGFYTRDGRLVDTPQWPTFSIARNVRDAWVVDSNPDFKESLSGLESEIIDYNNCDGNSPPTGTEPVSLIYLKEVQFLESPELNFHLGAAAARAEQSLGFSQGELATITADVPVYAPPGIYRKYKLFWHDVWEIGTMVIDFDTSNTRRTFRARIGMTWTLESYNVDCPP